MSAFTNQGMFADNAVPLTLLRERAFNMRWAQQPDGVIPLTAADPDFAASPVIRESLIRHVRDGVFSYAPPEGLPRFREAAAGWFVESRGIDCTAEDVFATDSAASAIAAVARASLKFGDQVFIPDPVDFLFQHAIERMGAKPIRIVVDSTTCAQSFIAQMQAELTSRTRMLWLCNPHNPLGVVYSREWLQTVTEWAVAHGLRILSDEIWSDIVYAPHEHVSVASLSDDIAAKTVTVFGFSKSYALAGLRVGCLVCTDAEWREQIVSASDARSTVFGVSVLSQVAAVAALEEGQSWLSAFIKHLQSQRAYAVERLSRWPGVTTVAPQGTYVIFPDVHQLCSDAEEFCARVRAEAQVALVPGATRWFGNGAHGHVRICFATSRGILQEAFDRMEPLVLSIANTRLKGGASFVQSSSETHDTLA